jgi:heat shock protein HslJ
MKKNKSTARTAHASRDKWTSKVEFILVGLTFLVLLVVFWSLAIKQKNSIVAQIPSTDNTASPEATLASTTWIWQGIILADGTKILPGEANAFALEFLDDNRVGVQTDCNSGSNLYTLSGNQLKIEEPGVTTLQACLDSQEADFRDWLTKVTSYQLQSGALVLDTSAGDQMIFTSSALAEID